LLRLICGFERADAGRIVIGGQVVAADGVHMAPERRRIGYVAQDGALFPHLSVADNIVFGLGRAARRHRRGVDALLELVGLPASFAARPPHELSGGEQQRVALARALAPEPSLVLLDEPFSALDAALRVETRSTVAAAIAAAGATALLVTHDQSEALSMGQRVAVLRDGHLVQVASPADLYRRPVDAALARFVGEAVLLPGALCDGGVACGLGCLPLAHAAPAFGRSVTVMVRPEQIRLLPDGGVRARVCDVTFYGHDASVRLAVGGEHVIARVSGHAVPLPGAEVGLAVDGQVIAYPADPG